MDASLKSMIASRDVEGIARLMKEHGLVLSGSKIVPQNDISKSSLKKKKIFWNQRQQARKILLNSLYGALLNAALRFHDERLGQSVTLTGRSIVRHMNAKINEIITGEYDYEGKGIIYSDTDSSYFSIAYGDNVVPGRDEIVELYDAIAEAANESFPSFMSDTFNTSLERGGIIKAGRELIASRGIFIKKKKYAVLVYDKEGKRLDKGNSPGELKAMGLDLKRSDTPKFMQTFLERILMDILQDAPKQDILGQVKDFRTAFRDRPAIEKGSPKKVNGLTAYGEKLAATKIRDICRSQGGKEGLPGHVRASMTWNMMCDIHDDKHSMRITDGSRIIVCKLKPNPNQIDSIAYPMDQPHLPSWFTELPFDEPAMEEVIIDKKVTNLIGVLDWDLSTTKTRPGDEFFKF